MPWKAATARYVAGFFCFDIGTSLIVDERPFAAGRADARRPESRHEGTEQIRALAVQLRPCRSSAKDHDGDNLE
jgi:hypothetical protein